MPPHGHSRAAVCAKVGLQPRQIELRHVPVKAKALQSRDSVFPAGNENAYGIALQALAQDAPEP